ncbi:MAG: RsmB/NOP family class I SAM-dependent RNA methyltransferase [Candidatus Pacearchaeota archaeon]
MPQKINNIINKAKPEQVKRLKELMPDEDDWKSFCQISDVPVVNSIRVNTLKISVSELKNRLEKKSWKVSNPFKNYPEIMIIEGNLLPGELGKSVEHILGYYYIQEIASMMPIIALNPKENEIVLDIAAAPGSKTTQAAMYMNNKGTIIANDISIGRIGILSTNIQRCGVSNALIIRSQGEILCKKLEKINMKMDKILVDAPCSGEGTIRTSIQSIKMFSMNLINKLSTTQKRLIDSAISILKENGELVYSTCTHTPEENEAIVSYILKNYNNIKIKEINLPLKTRPGIMKWNKENFHKDVSKCLRIYPQDNNTEGFFIAKLKKEK